MVSPYIGLGRVLTHSSRAGTSAYRLSGRARRPYAGQFIGHRRSNRQLDGFSQFFPKHST